MEISDYKNLSFAYRLDEPYIERLHRLELANRFSVSYIKQVEYVNPVANVRAEVEPLKDHYASVISEVYEGPGRPRKCDKSAVLRRLVLPGQLTFFVQREKPVLPTDIGVALHDGKRRNISK